MLPLKKEGKDPVMKSVSQHPVFTTEEARRIAAIHYGIKASATRLPGEVDTNIHLMDAGGAEYLLKASPLLLPPEQIELQVKLAAYLDDHIPEIRFPVAVKDRKGRLFFQYKAKAGETLIVRLLRWVPGKPLGEVNPRSEPLLEKWGVVCGKISGSLQHFDHPAAHRFYAWDPSMAVHAEKLMGYITTHRQRKMVEYFLTLFREMLPLLNGLRKSVNYNDAHEQNLLVDNRLPDPGISGIIDLGDAVYTHTVNEIAIAAAYAMLGMPDPLQAAVPVIRGYHHTFPLTEEEVRVLFPLITARLVISVMHAAENRVNQPDNPYLQISTAPAWQTLEQLMRLSPDIAHYTFRESCGWEPVPHRKAYDKWLNKNKDLIQPVINVVDKKITSPDLSVGSQSLGHFTTWETTNRFSAVIDKILFQAGADMGIGGYGESRPFYTTDAFASTGNDGPRWRSVHLGTDLWTIPGEPVVAPLEGKVHSFRHNRGFRDYGPTIILEHNTDDGMFYTLYGHLSSESLSGLEKGQAIQRGEILAYVGGADENGNWPPHLHFQVILDMLGNHGDFPGACTPDTATTWMSLCPDPTGFCGISTVADKQPALESDEILKKRKEILGTNLSISYHEPLHIVRGQMQFLLDKQGRRYLDTVNNVAHVGHEHPRVVAAAKRQISLLNTNTRYLHENIIRYGEKLLSTFPPVLSRVYFVNSGSEANELALRMAETFTGSREMVVVEMGYHGNTGRMISVSSYKFDRKGGTGAPPTTHMVPMPDLYRGLYRDPVKAGALYAKDIARSVKKIHQSGQKTAGFICESIMSCGGQIVLPEGYLQEAYSIIREDGGVCIADEVQVGFGRVGAAFWGFQLQGVIPDIVTLGKPMGNGHPLGAVVTTRSVADSFDNGMEYFNTYGGNPVSCAIGMEVLDIIRDEGLQQHAEKTGNYLRDCLIELQQQHPVIGDVRGHGLFLGFELVTESEKRQPATLQGSYLINRMRKSGILMSTDGPDDNVIKIKPPMCVDRTDVHFLVDTLDRILKEDFLRR